ncbi:MAG: DUF692 domain-containing protein [Pseudomonadota bacterium]
MGQYRDDQQAPALDGVGIGLRAPHYADVLATLPSVGWLEVHGENYFGAGGTPHVYLDAIRAHYPLSVHCVGMSLGAVDPLDRRHLGHLKNLIARYQPALVSDHLCWGAFEGTYFNDLLPLPYTEEALSHLTDRVAEAQDILGRQMLVENVSSYLEYEHSVIAEWDFLNALADRSGSGILLDINNIHVSACNHGFDARAFIDAIDPAFVQEMHLAGFAVNEIDGREILIDHHGARVAEAVWALYEHACARFPGTPTLIEWDTDIPPLTTLLGEAERARRIMGAYDAVAA